MIDIITITAETIRMISTMPSPLLSIVPSLLILRIQPFIQARLTVLAPFRIVRIKGDTGGINAGIFEDSAGAGTGWPPSGITISQGVIYEEFPNGYVAGISRDGILYVGDYSIDVCVRDFDIQNACSFGPILIANGQKMDEKTLESGVNPRTCIGQRGDGAIMLLVVDGRQAYSFGLTYGDCADLLLEYGCINAMNMDGGSSTSMYYKGQLVNHPSNQAGGTRYLPTAWLFK